MGDCGYQQQWKKSRILGLGLFVGLMLHRVVSVRGVGLALSNSVEGLGFEASPISSSAADSRWTPASKE